jgi:HD superfamily phosphodiesterase
MKYPKELEIFQSEFLASIESLYSRKDKAHDFTHIMRILENLRKFGEIEDRKLMYLAALIHGVWKREETRPLLEEYFGKDYAERAIRLSNRAKSSPLSLYEKILHDAHLLEALGAIGIARAYTKGGYENQTLKETTAILVQNAGRRFLTETGRKLEKDRITFLRDFFKRLNRESYGTL